MATETRVTTEDEKIDKMIDQEIERQRNEEKAEHEKQKTLKKKKEPKKEATKEEKEITKKKEPKKEAIKKETKTTEKSTQEEQKGRDPWKVLKYPHLAEKSMNMVETENKLIFIVHKKASKGEIQDAIEDAFNVKVIGVKTQITRKGDKKAYIKLHPDSDAADVATRLGVI